jgi:hypothetical protein
MTLKAPPLGIRIEASAYQTTYRNWINSEIRQSTTSYDVPRTCPYGCNADKGVNWNIAQAALRVMFLGSERKAD